MFRLITVIMIILNTTGCYGISLEESIEKAIKNSEKIKSKFYKYKSAELQLKSLSVSRFLPEVNLQHRFNEIPDSKLQGSETILNMKHRLIDSGERLAIFHHSQYLLKVEKLNFYQSKQEVALKAVQTYVDVLRAEEMLKLRVHKESVALENLSAMQKRFSLNEVTNAEVSLAKAKFSSSVSKKVEAEGKLKLARLSYYNLIGEEADNLPKIDELSLPTISELDESLQSAKINNLKLKEAIYRKNAARMGVYAEVAKFLPSLNLNVNGVRSFNSGVNDRVNFTLTLDVPIFNRGLNTFGLGKTKMDIKDLTYAYHEAVKDVEQAVINCWNNILTTKAMIEASQEAETAAALALKTVEQEVKLNFKSTTDLLETEYTLFKVRSELVEAKSSYVISVYNLLSVTNNMNI
ncbi:MAG: TolC family protein [Wolbachia endosymbiont of Fragariocoptes setiger]|nr:TolC family protein [Wolbachia endosymbiont of Fragariocoptes setiger]